MGLAEFHSVHNSTSTATDWADEVAEPPRQDDSYNDRRGGYGGDRGGDRQGDYRRDDRQGEYRRDDQGDRDRRPPREPTPVPDRPPYVAYVGNLVFDATEAELEDFFASQCKVSSVRLVTDPETRRPKGFGYVEFGDKDSLIAALGANGVSYAGRPIRVDVADQKDSKRGNSGGSRFGSDRGDQPPSEADSGPWRRGEALPPRPVQEPRSSPFGGRPSNFDERRQESRGGEQRKQLNLQPRTQPLPDANPPAVSYAGKKNNPFGEAKPRDELAWQKKKQEAEKAAKSPELKAETPPAA